MILGGRGRKKKTRDFPFVTTFLKIGYIHGKAPPEIEYDSSKTCVYCSGFGNSQDKITWQGIDLVINWRNNDRRYYLISGLDSCHGFALLFHLLKHSMKDILYERYKCYVQGKIMNHIAMLLHMFQESKQCHQLNDAELITLRISDAELITLNTGVFELPEHLFFSRSQFRDYLIKYITILILVVSTEVSIDFDHGRVVLAGQCWIGLRPCSFWFRVEKWLQCLHNNGHIWSKFCLVLDT